MSKSERRKAETKLQATLVACDLLAVLAAVALAYGIRFHSVFTMLVPVTKGVPSLGLYLAAGLAMATVWVPLFAALGLYRPRNRLDFPTQFDLALRGVGLGILVAFALTFFYRGATFSRLVLPAACALALLLVPALRIWVGRWMAHRHLPPAGVAVVGSGAAAHALAARLARRPAPGLRFVGLFADRPPPRPAPAAAGAPAGWGGPIVEGPPARWPSWSAGDDGRLRAGPVSDVVAAAGAGSVDRVFLTLAADEAPRLPELLATLADRDVDVDWVPDLPELGGRARIELIEGLPVIPLGEFPLLGWNGVAKRTMDIGLSALGLVVMAPVLAGLAVAVRLTGPGPIIYRQERVGRDGRPFRMLKFRSMVTDAEAATGPVRTRRDDPRTTRVGRFMRRTSLDELPQLWNVLRGEMSLVGPRPERPALIEGLVHEIPDYLNRHRVKSGMTGWAQVHGLRGADSSMEERVFCDLYYIENWSIWLDLRILMRTLLVMFREPNAY